MFLDWKNQYYENDYSTQSNLQIECNAYQITDGIFHRTRTKNFTLCKETQKTPNSQRNLEKEKRARGIRLPNFRLYYKSYSNQDNMVVAQKQKQRSIKYDRWPRDKTTHIWPANWENSAMATGLE